MTMKEFVSAADEANRDESADNEYPFVLDAGTPRERELIAYHPGDGQIAILMAETGRHTNLHTKVAGAIDFFQSVFSDDDAVYLRNRLLDRTDDFGMPTVQAIIEWLLEEWSGRPTGAPSASTRSRSSASPKSRPTTRRSA